MNNEQLENFITIIDEKSFSAAEEKAFISKQALLKQMDSLENELGFKLIIRNKRGVVPTEQGKIFYAGAKKLLDTKEEIINKCRNIKQVNTIRIAEVEHQVLLRPVIDEFRTKFPKVKFETIMYPNRSGEYRIENNIMDIGETFKDSGYNNVQYDKLADFPYVAVMDRHHPLANKKEVSLKECSKYKTSYFAIMHPESFNKLIHKIYKDTNNLYVSQDVDHHINLMYESLNTENIFITFNPFVYYTDDFAIVPLKEKLTEEYGIITSKHHDAIIDRFIEIAKKIYAKENPILKRKFK